MAFIGEPITVQNTDVGEWIVMMNGVASSSIGESISITVSLRRDPYATLADIQARAVARAIELLQGWQAPRS